MHKFLQSVPFHVLLLHGKLKPQNTPATSLSTQQHLLCMVADGQQDGGGVATP
jgi:hypothetical protein